MYRTRFSLDNYFCSGFALSKLSWIWIQVAINNNKKILTPILISNLQNASLHTQRFFEPISYIKQILLLLLNRKERFRYLSKTNRKKNYIIKF